jgi:DNA-binding beta-propeller fold protein YncE
MKLLSFAIPLLLAHLLVPPALAVENREAFDLMKEGVRHFNRREYEAAVDFFRRSIGKSPKDWRSRYFLGMAYYKAGFDENAVFEFGNLVDDVGLAGASAGGGASRGAEGSPGASAAPFGPGSELLGTFIRFLSGKQFLLQRERRNADYALGRELKTASLGKYLLTKCTGFDVDEGGNMYVASFGSRIALKVSQTGKPVYAFSRLDAEQGRLYDIAAGPDGYVYVSDFTKDQVYVYREEGRSTGVIAPLAAKFVSSIGGPGSKEGRFYGPTAIALDRFGDIYVIDSGNKRVQKFSRQGDFLLAFGREGDEEGEFRHPSGIAVDPSGRIYVSDHGKKTIQVYDRSGNYLGPLGGHELQDPYGLSIAGRNRLVVADAGRVLVYDLRYSTWTEIDTGGRFRRVLDAGIDRLEQLYAVDYDKDSLFQFVPKADKYRNLTVILDRVDVSELPRAGYYVTVLDADGLPVYGLEADNFLLRLGESRVGPVDLLSDDLRNSRLSILFLLDKSPAMAQHEADLRLAAERLLSKVAEEDQMAVLSFGADSWIASSFTRSKLRTMDALLEARYREGRGFDRAFRRGIDYLNKEFYKKAVVLLTDGLYTDQSFRTYSLLSCIDYAMNNHIPVYVLNFGARESEALSTLARSTGGRQYDALRSSELSYLYETMKAARSPEYLVVFSETRNPSLGGLYLDAEVEVDFGGRFGKSRLGCIYP